MEIRNVKMPLPTLLKEGGKASDLLTQRKSWLKEDGITLRRPDWINKIPNVKPFIHDTSPMSLLIAGQRIDKTVKRVQDSIRRSKAIALIGDAIALEKLQTDPPQSVTSTMVSLAEETYKKMEQDVLESDVTLGIQFLNKQQEQREKSGNIKIATSLSKEETPLPQFELSNGHTIIGKRAELLKLIKERSEKFKTINSLELMEVLYEGVSEKGRQSLMALISSARQELTKGKKEELVTLSKQGKNAEYLFLSPQGNFSNYEMSTLIQYLQTKNIEISELGITALEKTHLQEMKQCFPVDAVKKPVDGEDIIQRRRELFSKVENLLNHENRNTIIPAIKRINNNIGIILQQFSDIHDSLSKAETPKSLGEFFMSPKPSTVVTLDLKSRKIETS